MLKLRSLSDHGFLVATLLCSLPLLGQQTSTTMLSATPTATSIGQAVSINATVTGPSNTIPIPSGSVSFLDGSTSLGSVALSGLAVVKPIVVAFAQLFGAISSSSMGTVLWADFNGDGKSDLLSYGVISSTSDSVQVFLNNGDGTFTASSSQNLALGTISLIDFNGDGKLDLISPVSSSVEVSYGNGDGTFQAPIAAPGIVAPTSTTPSTLTITPSTLAIADLTGTGVPYIILGDQSSSPGGEAPYASITIFKNNGNGNFTPLGSFPAGTVGSINSQTIKQIVPVDMNGDDILDLAVTMQTGIARSSYFSAAVLLNKGSGTFQPAIPTVINTTCFDCRTSLVTGDFANRGKADIALLDINSNVIHLYPGNGDGTVGAAVDTRILDNTYQLMTEDINGDGKLDIVESGGYAYLGNGDFTFTPTANLIKLGGLGFGGATAGSLIADFNSDSIPDILFNYRDSFGKQAAAVELGSRSAFAALPSITSLAVGVHPISADYAGDSIFVTSASSIIDVTVSKYATTTTGSGTPNPVLSTQNSTLSVQVASSGPVPTGTLTFTIGSTVLGTATLNPNGVASISVVFGAAGTQNVTVAYSGDASNLASTGTISVVTVANFPSSVSFTASPNPSVAGQSILLTAIVAPSGTSPTPTGNVVFLNGTTRLGMAALDATGKASLNTSFATNGNQTVTANYVGDTVNQPSSAAIVEAILSAFDFQPASGSSTAVTVQSGSSGTVPLTVTALNGFSGSVSFSCSGLPSGATCNFSPANVTVSASTPGAVTLTVSAASTLGFTPAVPFGNHGTIVLATTFCGCVLFLLPGSHRRRIRMVSLLCAIVIVSSVVGCGGSSNSPVKSATYNFNVIATSGAAQTATAYNLTVR